MSSAAPRPRPRVVVVTRKTDYEVLLTRHSTRGQAEFFLARRGRGMHEVDDTHHAITEALDCVLRAVPEAWRRQRVDRSDLDRFVFEPGDLVLVLGQDGLVANVAKYLQGQPVIGVNPLPGRFDGALVQHAPEAAEEVLRAVAAGRAAVEERTMVGAALDDGQQLLAVNEIFVGHRTHQSARYRLGYGKQCEHQSSSGLIVVTGTGSTGWARSIHRACHAAIDLPVPTDPALAFFVREAFPSISTGTDLTQGLIAGGEALEVVSEMNSDGVAFGDGIESDRIELSWGQRLVLRRADRALRLIAA